jgi:hypothetical protein
MFVQSVYLLFSAVYVCKETVEHVLLSAGDMGGERHHHHFHGSDEDGVSGYVSWLPHSSNLPSLKHVFQDRLSHRSNIYFVHFYHLRCTYQ